MNNTDALVLVDLRRDHLCPFGIDRREYQVVCRIREE